MWKPYIVTQGDYLTKLAHRFGFNAAEVWNDSRNSHLKATRSSMDMLAPGDIIQIPVVPRKGLPFVPGKVNRYVAKVPKVTVRVVLMQEGAPLVNELFVVEGLPEPLSGTTKEDGCVMFQAPITLREASIVLPVKNLAYSVRIGDLDPRTELSGKAMRLAHLGCYGWFPELEGDFDMDQYKLAVATFQEMISSDPTGECDEETRSALCDRHGV